MLAQERSVSPRALSLSCPCPGRGYEIILALTALLVRMHHVALWAPRASFTFKILIGYFTTWCCCFRRILCHIILILVPNNAYIIRCSFHNIRYAVSNLHEYESVMLGIWYVAPFEDWSSGLKPVSKSIVHGLINTMIALANVLGE